MNKIFILLISMLITLCNCSPFHFRGVINNSSDSIYVSYNISGKNINEFPLYLLESPIIYPFDTTLSHEAIFNKLGRLEKKAKFRNIIKEVKSIRYSKDIMVLVKPGETVIFAIQVYQPGILILTRANELLKSADFSIVNQKSLNKLNADIVSMHSYKESKNFYYFIYNGK